LLLNFIIGSKHRFYAAQYRRKSPRMAPMNVWNKPYNSWNAALFVDSQLSRVIQGVP